MNIYTVNQYIKDTYGCKMYKISLSAATTCPNRDGTAGYGGCIFCSEQGSGDFAAVRKTSVYAQIEEGKKLVSAKNNSGKYIAYFQSFTNTYGNLNYLRSCFLEACNHPDIAIISIATRPDCIDDNVIKLIEEIASVKPVWIELGLQTIHDRTAKLINRCYNLNVYNEAVDRLKKINVHIIVHMIIGLPYETKEDMIATAAYIGRSGVHGIKLQLLHVLKNTPLEKLYNEHVFDVLTLEEYTDILVSCLKVLPSDMVIHRMTGDGPKKLLTAPMWSCDKKRVLNTINRAIINAD
jgi:hypothetical protein